MKGREVSSGGRGRKMNVLFKGEAWREKGRFFNLPRGKIFRRSRTGEKKKQHQ